MEPPRSARPPAVRYLAAGGFALLVLAAGCAGASPQSPAPSSVRPPSSAAPTPPVTLPPESVSPTEAFLDIKDPIGVCLETATTIEPPTDYEELCTYRRMVIGHTLPPGGETYLSRLVPVLQVGSLIRMEDQDWQVSEITSIPKTALPDVMYAEDGPERYLVTCDPESGYTRWSDGIMHSNNNLIVTLVPN